MGDPKILIGQFFQKIHPAHAVRQCMEHFDIDPPAVIGDPKQITVVSVVPDITAGIMILLIDSGGRLAVFLKVIPKKALSESHVKAVKLGKHDVQRLLQFLRIHILGQRRADPVNTGQLFSRDDGKKIGGVVEAFPFDGTHAFFPTAFALSLLFFFVFLCGTHGVMIIPLPNISLQIPRP